MNLFSSILTILILGYSACEVIQLFSASIDPESSSSTLRGSLRGGTIIYIYGVGFPRDPREIQVWVGNKQCVIGNNGVTPTMITCQTSNSNSNVDISSLEIIVISNGESYTLPSNTFSYSEANTPLITDIFPSSSVPGSYLNLYGKHRVNSYGDGLRDTGDFKGIYIGDTLCSMFDISQTRITYNDVTRLQCLQSETQIAGKKNVSEHVLAGLSNNHYSLRKASLEHEYYEYAVLPEIVSIEPNAGFESGQTIKIKGNGFSTNKNDVEVDIDGVECLISVSTNKQITCAVQPKNSNHSALLNTTSSSQIDGYISGSGFHYSRYDTTQLSSKTISSLKSALANNQSNLTLIESKKVSELTSPDIYGTNYAQVFKGYFFAPTSGNYTFRGSADDFFELSMNEKSGTTSGNLSKIIFSNSNGQSSDNYYISNITSSLGSPIYLEEGNYYYTELYHLNNGGSGWLKVSVEVFNNDINLAKQTFEVDHIETTFTNQPEIIEFALSNAQGGNFNISLSRANSKTLKVTYFNEATINFNATASQFVNVLNQFDGFNNQGISCLSVLSYDNNGEIVPTYSGVKTVWRVQINRLRNSTHLSEVFGFKLNNIINSTSTASFQQKRIQNHGSIISGSFTLQIGGYNVPIYDRLTQSYSNENIPYDVSADTLQSALRQIPGFGSVEVSRTGEPSYGAKWIISFVDFNEAIEEIIVSASGLSGGQEGTSPEIGIYQDRGYSSNILFNPINEKFLFSPSAGPQVIVKVNGLQSVCRNNCSYTFLSVIPKVTSQKIINGSNGAEISIQIEDPQNFNYDLSEVSVKVSDADCEIQGGTFTDFTCTLPLIEDSFSPAIAAGSYSARVSVPEGIIITPIEIETLDYAFTFDRLVPNRGPMAGGIVITVIGTGFNPSPNYNAIIICGTFVYFETSNYTHGTFVLPACGYERSYLMILAHDPRGVSDEIEIFENDPKAFVYHNSSFLGSVNSVFPTSSSPVLKTPLEITGVGFGTNKTAIEVYLMQNGSRMYRLAVLKMNDTYIKVGLGGGKKGNYKVQVVLEGVGEINGSSAGVNNFAYEVYIQSIISNGTAVHLNNFLTSGGNLITITGKNFIPNKEETTVLVFFDLICEIETINTTTITCILPGIDLQLIWANNNQYTGYVMRVYSKLTEVAECRTTCIINYGTPTASPLNFKISNITPETIVSGPTETNLLLSGSFNLSSLSLTYFDMKNKITNQRYVFPITLTNRNQSSFLLPANLVSGLYEIRGGTVRGHGIPFSFIVEASFATTTGTASIYGGKVISLEGTGLPNSWPSQGFTLTITVNNQILTAEVLSCNRTSFSFRTPYTNSANNAKMIAKLTTPSGQFLTYTITQLTSATPQVNYNNATQIPAGTIAIQLTQTSLTTQQPTEISVFNILNPQEFEVVSGWTRSGNSINFNHEFKAGGWRFRLLYPNGFSLVPTIVTVLPTTAYELNHTEVSYAGGIIKVSNGDINKNSIVKVLGFEGKFINLDNGIATFEIPKLVTPEIQTLYPTLTESVVIKGSPISDGGSSPSFAFDGIISSFYQSKNSECFVGIDIGEGKLAKITKIKYFPYYMWARSSDYISGGVFEASVDGINFRKIGEIDQGVRSGWNSIPINVNENYRYIRLAHTNVSGCRVSEIEVIGIQYSDVQIVQTSSQTLNATIFDGVTTQTFPNSITYSLAKTPIVASVLPKVGSVSGGDIITLSGSKFDLGTPKIIIDGYQCEVISGSITPTSVSCLTAFRESSPKTNSFKVSFGGSYAIIEETFLYVQRWSDDRTWGIDIPPLEGDVVYVPEGMTLLIDESPPKLAGIVVLGGKIIFADESDLELHTDLITIFNGELIAGSESSPYQHKLNIVVYGDVKGQQLPIFGNKVVGCFNCKLSLHGKARLSEWTEISTSVFAGTNKITVTGAIDWEIGETIVIGPTGFNHKEAERRVITQISGNTITVNQNFNFDHISSSEVFGNHTLSMKAEVGLLTRTITIKGSEESQITNFGVNLLIAGDASNGLVAKVANIEISNCGQASQLRYCIHFEANGDLADSYVTGVSIHNSFARGIVLNGAISYVKIKNNVLFDIEGHGIALHSAGENFNTIENNLVIGVYSSFNLYQTDISASAFYITNPTNTLIANRAAGSDFYGFWFPIQSFVSRDVCPTGGPLGEVRDSIVHSNGVSGLRINRLAARTFPCKSLRDEEDEDPYSANPSIQSVFNNFILYKNVQSNILVEQVGNTLFTNFTLAESKVSSVEFHRTNLTKELVKVEDFVIVGVSATNYQSNLSYYNGNKGLIAPRTSGFKISNTHFYNFPVNTTVFETCSGCANDNVGSNSVNEYLVENINFENVSGRYVSMGSRLNDIIYDLDGSLSTYFDGSSRNRSTFVGNLNHFIGEEDCISSASSQWSDILVCEESITIRKVTFTNLQNVDLFRGVYARVQRIDSIYDTIEESPYNSTHFYNLQNGYAQSSSLYTSIIYQYSLPFVAGRTYAIWWESIDFNNLAIDLSPLFDDNDSGIIFKFNYTAHRELFDIYHLVDLEKTGDSIMPFINDTLNETDCQLGENVVDLDNKTLSVCVSSRGKNQTEQYLQIDAIKCRYVCEESDEFEKENFYRLWSNVTQWPEGRLPNAGENVTIKGPWTVILDMTPADINFLTIDGTLTVPNILASGNSITANNIWVRAGVFQIGTSESIPYPGRFTITLKGNNSNAFTSDLSGRKIFLNTGKVNFFGSSPADEVTRMVSLARRGDTTIQVTSPVSDWAIGDKIVIGPTWRNESQHEKVTITGINSTSRIITFTPPLEYSHYGNISTYFPLWKTVQSNLPYQYLDCRGAVINLNRKIVVQSAGDDFGFHMFFKGYLAGERLRSGSGTLQGVQFIGGGQANTEHNSLRITNTVGSEKIIVRKSSFENCLNGCLDVSNPFWFEAIDNVFFKAETFHIRTLKVDGNLTLDSNTMIGVYKRKSLKENQEEMVGCILAYDYVFKQNIFVKHNLCQGSQVHGYALPFTEADTMLRNWEYGLNFNNTVGSAEIGFIYGQTYDAWFVALFTFNVYACDIGFLANTYETSTIHVRYGVIADCKVGTDIQIRNKNSTYYMNMGKPFHMAYIAVLRPNCTECYGPETTPCSNNVAMRPITAVQEDRRMPEYFGKDYNAINGDPSVSALMAVAISIFDSWRSSYPNLPQCKNNTIIKAKEEWTDYISPVTFETNSVDSILINCEEGSLVYFQEPRTDDLGYYGGCGDMACQGHEHYYIANNTLIQHSSSEYYIYSYIPHKIIGANEPDCVEFPSINGYKCYLQRTRTWALLDFASIAPDYRSRVVWPIYVNYDGGKWNVSVNAPKEKHWSGPNPLGTRISRFHVLTRTTTTTNLIFSKQVPTDMIFRMNNGYEAGDNYNLTVRIQYNTPNSIRVSSLYAGVIRPFSTTSDDVRRMNTVFNITACGFHQYFYENNTIQFNLIRAPNCIVRLTVTNSIQLSAWLSMDINDFYAMDGENLFVDRIAAALNITDRSRIKIVGAYSGSVNIIAFIEETITSTFENSTEADPTAGQNEMLEIHDKLRIMNQNGEIALALASVGLPLADLSSALYFNNIEEENKEENEKKTKKLLMGLVIGVSVGGAMILIIGFIAVMYFMRKRGKVEQINVDEDNTNTIKIERKLGEDNSSLTDFEIKNIRGTDRE